MEVHPLEEAEEVLHLIHSLETDLPSLAEPQDPQIRCLGREVLPYLIAHNRRWNHRIHHLDSYRNHNSAGRLAVEAAVCRAGAAMVQPRPVVHHILLLAGRIRHNCHHHDVRPKVVLQLRRENNRHDDRDHLRRVAMVQAGPLGLVPMALGPDLLLRSRHAHHFRTHLVLLQCAGEHHHYQQGRRQKALA